jgi:hypothetical protein
VEALVRGDVRRRAPGNYERIFDKARRDVRAWEKAHAK